MPTFESARLKIERAESQARNLYDQATEFFFTREEPSYRIEFERDTDPRKWRAIFRLLKKPPDDWPILLGEIVHNLRSALDHLVYEASALDEDGMPLKGTEYPIFMDEKLFRDRGLWRIRGLNDATRAFVVKYQPFAHSDPKVIPYLWLLQQLSNTDKHRLLNIVAFPHEVAGFRLFYARRNNKPLTRDHVVSRILRPKGVPLKDGAEYFAFWTKKALPADTQVDMNTQITVNVTFGDATPVANGLSVLDTVRGIGRYIGGIRNEFIKMNPGPS